MENKIDIRDLRVGDWVEFNTGVHQIEATDFVKWKSDGMYSKKFIECNPIPLTEEILIKNGFPEDEWHGSFPEDKNGLLYIVLSFNKIFWEFNDCRIEIKSVHQLQNILQDLGIGKEIKV